MYYSTNYIDEDLGSDFGESDEEAEEEEKEALRLQKEQAAMFDEVVYMPVSFLGTRMYMPVSFLGTRIYMPVSFLGTRTCTCPCHFWELSS
jgi:hypothetical protein